MTQFLKNWISLLARAALHHLNVWRALYINFIFESSNIVHMVWHYFGTRGHSCDDRVDVYENGRHVKRICESTDQENARFSPASAAFHRRRPLQLQTDPGRVRILHGGRAHAIQSQQGLLAVLQAGARWGLGTFVSNIRTCFRMQTQLICHIIVLRVVFC